MTTILKYTIYLLLLIALIALNACQHETKKKLEVPYYNTPDFSPIWQADNTDKLHTVPDFSFINQSGDTITQKETENKIYLVNFFFTTCSGICPRMTETLQRVHDRFKNDPNVLIISHSVDPETDTPEKLKAFADRYGISDPGWQFVTGDKDSIYTLARKGYFVEQVMGYDKASDEFLHSENIILVDSHKHIRGLYNGTVLLDAGRMIDDIGKLKMEN